MNNETMEKAIVEIPEEVIEKTETLSSTKIAVVAGLSAMVGMVTYDYIVKPVVTNLVSSIGQAVMKRREKKKQTIEVDAVDVD